MVSKNNPYKHPIHVVELEGVHVVKDNNDRFTYLSDNMGFDHIELKDHDSIVEHLAQLSITPEELEFDFVGNNLFTAFLDA